MKIRNTNNHTAEGRIGGCLRGGVIIDGYFCACGPVGAYHKKPINFVQDLKIRETIADDDTIAWYRKILMF